MTRKAVTSSNLRSVGYDATTRTLEIEFKKSVYQYADVPLEVYEALMAAPSHGSYFIQNIRDVYPVSRIS
jgi:KTSC domain